LEESETKFSRRAFFSAAIIEETEKGLNTAKKGALGSLFRR
jgi:hypothetical protein